MKRCSKCGEEKDLSAFVREKSKRSGFGASCKVCKHAQNRAWRARNPGYDSNRSCRERRRNDPVFARQRSRDAWASVKVRIQADPTFRAKEAGRTKAARRRYSAKNRLRENEHRKKWLADHPERRAEYSKRATYAVDPRRAAVRSAKTIIRQQTGLRAGVIPQELVEAKAAQLLVRRHAMDRLQD